MKLILMAQIYPDGVYYYKLEAGDYTETKKMVLIKSLLKFHEKIYININFNLHNLSF